eukprot:263841-Pyramimonas_sp.AAC.1
MQPEPAEPGRRVCSQRRMTHVSIFGSMKPESKVGNRNRRARIGTRRQELEEGGWNRKSPGGNRLA